MRVDQEKVLDFMVQNRSKTPDLSKNALAELVSSEFSVHKSTAKRWIDKHDTTEVKADLVPDEPDEVDTSDIESMTDEEIFQEMKITLIKTSRTAVYEKDRLQSMKILLQLMHSQDYKDMKEGKKQKPSMRQVGTLLSSLMLGVAPDTVEEYQEKKKTKKKKVKKING